MGANTKISWAHHTFNPVVGCTKVSAACDFCYAEAWAKRSGHPELWQGQRRLTSRQVWRQPLIWNRAARAQGVRPRVFCASLADVFDNQWEPEWRSLLWGLIGECTNLDWLLLTKRPQNIPAMLPSSTIEAMIGPRLWPWPHVWLGTTVENQEEADRRIPHLRAVSAARRFLSCEPLLGPLDLSFHLSGEPDIAVHWVIAGGESGPRRRPLDLGHVRSLRDQCASAGVAFHFKQIGGLHPDSGGCLLDGVEHKAFPEAA